MRKLPTLKAVRAFEAASRLGSIQQAADELRVTPSAVSHQIRFLEEEIGARLFHRAHRSIILTDVGRRYATEIGRALSQIEDATRNVRRGERSDILSIHVVPSLATQWLMPRISRFSEINAEIDLRLHASNNTIDLNSGTLDLAIQYGTALQQSGTVVEPFPNETIVALCSPRFLEGAHPLREPADLVHHQLIHSEVNLFGWPEWQKRHPGVRLNLDRGPRFDRSFMSISAAVDGRGVCLESLLLVEREIKSGSLVAPFGMEGPQMICHSLVYLKASEQLPKITSFRHWLFSELGNLNRSAGPGDTIRPPRALSRLTSPNPG
ncbi:transcriptional regulator GcvA [Xanthobacter tagetidis]|jgi:LysR family glycine cleavage system transcriptional activator|uniref:Transcriptional regulator GcvA n=1 Tax=Xanthobacter tagetidis TaxID=60216 RepID=A0A3L7A319_9HYPH|nr:transcriptional regulator GcvA [Xanthobacter tagetidis]MBB6309927.1 LysR family glycine cleavage system transcriptional activator [Xanthobacter tagetidis]RLP74639.1 transcriptional regulator GcvA [Xanthobacter tagetidis]